MLRLPIPLTACWRRAHSKAAIDTTRCLKRQTATADCLVRCGTIVLANDVEISELLQWNPSLASGDGHDHGHDCYLEPGWRYCVQEVYVPDLTCESLAEDTEISVNLLLTLNGWLSREICSADLVAGLKDRDERRYSCLASGEMSLW
ncbi:hypothetical protein PWT90_09000 [Aphanocladium album]|nr:hypothetical protein PWT90_09000 [Aphanocladium album]